jgi:hypothetical protein
MPSLLDQLATADAPTADKAISEWAANATPELDELLALLEFAPELRGRLTAFTVVEGPGGPITWRQFEHVLWTLGEGFRQILKRQPKLRGHPTLFKHIAALCLDPSYRKGRESFTMLLGQYGGPLQARTLVSLLADAEVEGHALLALRTLKAPGGRETAKRLLVEGNTWKRTEAKKYLRKMYPDEVAT